MRCDGRQDRLFNVVKPRGLNDRFSTVFKFLKKLVGSEREPEEVSAEMGNQGSCEQDEVTYPPGMNTFAFLGSVWCREGMYERAILQYENAIATQPEHCEHYLTLAHILIDKCDDHQRALEFLLQAKQLQERSGAQSADLQLLLAECAFNLDGIEPARGLLEDSQSLRRLEALLCTAIDPIQKRELLSFFDEEPETISEETFETEFMLELSELAGRLAEQYDRYGLRERALKIMQDAAPLNPDMQEDLQAVIEDYKKEIR